jgi:hypothetical protein
MAIFNSYVSLPEGNNSPVQGATAASSWVRFTALAVALAALAAVAAVAAVAARALPPEGRRGMNE